ncbi:MAG: hypothetical protein J6M12_02350 [Clostridia bacterium]|nr:hypothetical protein [Clostridia bacterium]
MSSKEKLNDAFSTISDSFLTECARPLKKTVFQKRICRLLPLVAVLVSIAILLPIAVFRHKSDLIPGRWTLISHADETVRKEMLVESAHKPTVSMSMNYNKLPAEQAEAVGFSPEKDPCVELFAQWFYSQITYDYRMHFSLFQKEAVDYSFTSEAIERGFTFESALDKLDTVTSHFYNGIKYDLFYSLVSCKDLTAELENTQGQFYKSIVRCGADPAKISMIVEYTFDDIKLIMNERFLNTSPDGERFNFMFYCYDGHWYIFETEMENDFSIDVLGKDEDWLSILIVPQECYGRVVAVGRGYLLLDNGEYFMTLDELDLKVGDYVHVSFTGFQTKGRFIADDGSTEQKVTCNNLLTVKLAEPSTPSEEERSNE